MKVTIAALVVTLFTATTHAQTLEQKRANVPSKWRHVHACWQSHGSSNQRVMVAARTRSPEGEAFILRAERPGPLPRYVMPEATALPGEVVFSTSQAHYFDDWFDAFYLPSGERLECEAVADL